MLFTGWGPIVLVVFFIIVFGAQRLFWSWTGEGRYFFKHPFTGLLIFASAGAVVWLLGRFMNRRPVHVEELDQRGRKLVAKPRHSICFIPAEYWGPILFVVFASIILLKR
jgi:hypothetical protein